MTTILVRTGSTMAHPWHSMAVELTRLRGHLILGKPWRKEPVLGRPSKYPPEFRREAIELVRSSGRSRVEVARTLGSSDNTLANWVRANQERRERRADPEALTESERVELRRLRRENAQLQIDMEVLRKAAPISRRTRRGEPLPLRRGAFGRLSGEAAL